MLSKAEIKACLAGEPTPIVPAYMMWFDEKVWNVHEEELRELELKYGNDFVDCSPTLVKRATDPELDPHEFTDEWGCRFGAVPDGVGSHPTLPIIRSLSEWEKYLSEGIPSIDPEVFGKPIIAKTKAHPDNYVVAAFWRTFYERMHMLMGYEELMVEIATEGEIFISMLKELRDFTIHGIELIGDTGADAVFLADDWGMQHTLQISPDMWRKYFRPAYAAMIDTAHSRGLDVWLHSCGNITDIIPDWIDIGLDVIAHLQTTALDLPAIAAAYRGQITFFGGIDVQHNLVHGDRDSIRGEIETLMTCFQAFEGKYIAAPSNTIMPETPIENVRILCEAIKDFGQMPSL